MALGYFLIRDHHIDVNAGENQTRCLFEMSLNLFGYSIHQPVNLPPPKKNMALGLLTGTTELPTLKNTLFILLKYILYPILRLRWLAYVDGEFACILNSNGITVLIRPDQRFLICALTKHLVKLWPGRISLLVIISNL